MWPESGPDRLEELCLQLMAHNINIIAQQCSAPSPRPSFSQCSTSVDSGTKEGETCVDDAMCVIASNSARLPPPYPYELGPSFFMEEAARQPRFLDSEDGSAVDSDFMRFYVLGPGVYLSSHLADRLFTILMEEPEEGRDRDYLVRKLAIFSDKQLATLSRADLRNVPDKWLMPTVKMLSPQPLVELTMPCVWRSFPIISSISTLRSLRLDREPHASLQDILIQVCVIT